MTQTRWTTAALALAVLTFVADAAYAQVSLRVRGTITGLNDNILSVKTREGKDLKLQLSEKVVVAAAKAIKLEELKAGDFIGTTTQAARGRDTGRGRDSYAAAHSETRAHVMGPRARLDDDERQRRRRRREVA